MASLTPQPLPAPQAYRANDLDLSGRLTGPLERRPIFTYAHYWHEWAYVETTADGVPVDAAQFGQGKGTGEWLPTLVKMPTMKGAGGAHTDRDIQATVTTIARKGGVAFLPGDRRLGKWADYLKVYLDAGGGQHFAEQFERAIRLPNGHIRFEPADPREYRAFLRHLRDSAVEPMAVQAYDAIRARAYTEIERLREASSIAGRGEAMLIRAEKVLAAMDEAWEREQARATGGASGVEMVAEASATEGIDYTEAERIARAAPKRGR